jgi:hypothetical protein
MEPWPMQQGDVKSLAAVLMKSVEGKIDERWRG